MTKYGNMLFNSVSIKLWERKARKCGLDSLLIYILIFFADSAYVARCIMHMPILFVYGEKRVCLSN